MTVTGEPDKPQQGVQSVEVGMTLARCLAGAPEAMTLKQLAAAAGMSPPKAHRYLVSLVRAGLVERHPATGRYDLGRLALEMGLTALGRLDVMELATQALHRVRERLDETVLLAVWGNRGPTVVRWLESSQSVTVNVRLGSVMPLLSSATGRVFLAYLPRAMTAALAKAEGGAPGSRYRTSTQIDALAEEVRARGLSHVRGDMLPGVAALGAPVFNHQGEAAAAIVALGIEEAFDDRWEGDVALTLYEESRALSSRLGHRQPS